MLNNYYFIKKDRSEQPDEQVHSTRSGTVLSTEFLSPCFYPSAGTCSKPGSSPSLIVQSFCLNRITEAGLVRSGLSSISSPTPFPRGSGVGLKVPSLQSLKVCFVFLAQPGPFFKIPEGPP